MNRVSKSHLILVRNVVFSLWLIAFNLINGENTHGYANKLTDLLSHAVHSYECHIEDGIQKVECEKHIWKVGEEDQWMLLPRTSSFSFRPVNISYSHITPPFHYWFIVQKEWKKDIFRPPESFPT